VVIPVRLGLRTLALTATLALVVIAAVYAWGPASAATVSVDAGNNYFCDASFDGNVCETDVTAGDTVTWTVSGGTHTITECNSDYSQCPPSGGWDSQIVSQGATYSQTFAQPGTYAYRCELHPSEMLGKIVVAAITASPTPVPTAAPTSGSTAGPTSTPVALPNTGGPVSDDGTTLYLVAGTTLIAGAALAFALARKRV
jgi:plastocyanin